MASHRGQCVLNYILSRPTCASLGDVNRHIFDEAGKVDTATRSRNLLECKAVTTKRFNLEAKPIKYIDEGCECGRSGRR